MLQDVRLHNETSCIIRYITSGICEDRVRGSDFQRSCRVHDIIANAGGFGDRRSGLATVIDDGDVIIVLIAVHDVERGITGIDRSCALDNALGAKNSDDRTVDIPQSKESGLDRSEERLGIDLAETL